MYDLYFYVKGFQSFLEGMMVLHGKHGGGHEHQHLFLCFDGFIGGSYGDFCFSKPHISAHKSIHRGLGFHILAYAIGGAGLVGGIFVDKGVDECFFGASVFFQRDTPHRFSFCVVFYEGLGIFLEFLFKKGFSLSPSFIVEAA